MFLNMSYVFIKNVTELLIFFNKISSFFSAAVGLLIVRMYERVSICASSESNMQIPNCPIYCYLFGKYPCFS